LLYPTKIWAKIPFLAYFPYFGGKKKMKVGLCNIHALCVPSHQLLNGWTSLYETWYVQGSWAYFSGVIYKSLPSVCVCMCIPLSFLGIFAVKKNVSHGNEYTRNNRRIVGPVVFYAARVVSRKVD
jgi:hypothetical protein